MDEATRRAEARDAVVYAAAGLGLADETCWVLADAALDSLAGSSLPPAPDAMGVIVRFVAFCEAHPEVLDIQEGIRYVFGDAVDLIAQRTDAASGPQSPPPQQIDAVAWALYDWGFSQPGNPAIWNDLDEPTKRKYRSQAEAALAASGPLPPPPPHGDAILAEVEAVVRERLAESADMPDDALCELRAVDFRSYLHRVLALIADVRAARRASAECGDAAEQLAEALRALRDAELRLHLTRQVTTPNLVAALQLTERALAAFSAPRTPEGTRDGD